MKNRKIIKKVEPKGTQSKRISKWLNVACEIFYTGGSYLFVLLFFYLLCLLESDRIEEGTILYTNGLCKVYTRKANRLFETSHTI